MKRPDGSEKRGGRKQASIAMPQLEDNFVEVMREQTAGDPMSSVIWTHRTQQEIADELGQLGTPVSTEVVRHLLDDFDFSKRKAQKSVTMGVYPARNEQFGLFTRICGQDLARVGFLGCDRGRFQRLRRFENRMIFW